MTKRGSSMIIDYYLDIILYGVALVFVSYNMIFFTAN